MNFKQNGWVSAQCPSPRLYIFQIRWTRNQHRRTWKAETTETQDEGPLH